MNTKSGFSIIELMISLSIAALIILGLNQCYLTAKTHYVQVQQLINEQLDLHYIASIIANSIRRAGFTPCTGIEHLQVYGGTISALRVQTTPQPLVQINRMYEWFYEVQEIVDTTQLVLDNAGKINPNHQVLISDCTHAELNSIVHQQKAKSHTLVQLANPLRFDYQQPIYIGEWLQEQFYLQKKGKKAALYYRDLEAEELSPLIHSLTIAKQRSGSKTVINLLMGLDDDVTYKLSVAIHGY